MSFEFFKSAVCYAGQNAISWAPIAIGLATNNPSILVATELAYAALQLKNMYYADNRLSKFCALSNAALSLTSPFTYHPLLAAKVSSTFRMSILAGLGVNNILNGGYETLSVVKDVVEDCKKPAAKNEEVQPQQKGESVLGKIAGRSLRFGLGFFRLYSGANQLKSSLHFFLEQPKAETTRTKPTTKKTKPGVKENKPRVTTEIPQKKYGKCFPKTGKRHPEDIAFYNHAFNHERKDFDYFTSASGNQKIKDLFGNFDQKSYLNEFYKNFPTSIEEEGRCEVILYLHSTEFNNPSSRIDTTAAQELIKAGRVATREVRNPSHICTQIDKVIQYGGKVKAVIIDGHGNKGYAVLGKNVKTLTMNSSLHSPILNMRTQFPDKECLNNLEPNAPIVLYSCYGGSKVDGGTESLADAIARQANGRKVYAATKSVSNFDLVIKNNKELQFSFQKKARNNPFDGLERKDVTYVAQAKTKKSK